MVIAFTKKKGGKKKGKDSNAHINPCPLITSSTRKSAFKIRNGNISCTKACNEWVQCDTGTYKT
jgi:hypothetical protein